MVYKAGEKPENESYCCTTCGEIVVQTDKRDTLPICPRCRNMVYIVKSAMQQTD